MRKTPLNTIFVADKDGNKVPFRITDVESVKEYNQRFNAEATKMSGGYKSYVNGQGLTNFAIAKSIGAQGLGKVMAQCLEGLHILIGQGGNDGAEAQTVLAALLGYVHVASNEIVRQNQQKLIDQARAMNITPARLAELIATPAESVVVPVATVTEEEAETEVETADETEPTTV